MDEFLKVFIPAVIGLVTGAIGSLIAPWVNWGVEKRRQKLAYRRELIAGWRKMVQEVTRTPDQPQLSLAQVLERHEAFYSLKPHLSHKVIVEIYNGRTFLVGSTIGAALSYMLDEIGQIEKKWGLV